MSFRVLVIPEDPTHNGYILKPLVEMVMKAAEKPTAKVTILTSPKLKGYDEALHSVRHDLATRYRQMDLWLFIPDADRASAAAMQDLESELAEQGVTLFCCPAVPEVEIYACVAYHTEIRMSWSAARRHPRFKEAIFERLLTTYGDSRRPGQGRIEMTERSLARRTRFFRRCPEIARLRDRIAALPL